MSKRMYIAGNYRPMDLAVHERCCTALKQALLAHGGGAFDNKIGEVFLRRHQLSFVAMAGMKFKAFLALAASQQHFCVEAVDKYGRTWISVRSGSDISVSPHTEPSPSTHNQPLPIGTVTDTSGHIHALHATRRGAWNCRRDSHGLSWTLFFCECRMSRHSSSSPNPTESSAPIVPVPTVDPVVFLHDTIDRLRDQLAEAQERGKCVVCMDLRASTLFLPCKHLCVCDKCGSEALKTCPLCVGRIETRLHGVFVQ